VVIVFFDVGILFFLNAMLTLFFVLVLYRITIAVAPPRHKAQSIFQQMRTGLDFALRDEGIRLMLVLLFLGGAGVRSVSELFPIFAERNFDSVASGLAFLTSGMAAGAILAGVTFGFETGLIILMRRVILGWSAASLALATLVFSTSHILDIMLVMLVGFCGTRAVIGTQTFTQLRAPEHLRGRTLSVHGLVARASPALGAVAIGWAFDRVGLFVPILICSAVILVAATFLALPRQRNYTPAALPLDDPGPSEFDDER